MELVRSNPASIAVSRSGEEFRLTELLGSVIAYAGYGLIVARPDRRIIYANDPARKLMRAANGLRSEKGVLVASDFDSSRQLQALVLAASGQTGGPEHAGSMIIRDADGLAALVIHSVSLSRSPMELAARSNSGAVGLLIFDCETEIEDRIKEFSELFSLTAAEMRVLSLLLTKGSVSQAAAELNMAQSTAQTHMKRILEKTGTHRQAELVKIFYEVTIPWPGRGPAKSSRLMPWRPVCLQGTGGEAALRGGNEAAG